MRRSRENRPGGKSGGSRPDGGKTSASRVEPLRRAAHQGRRAGLAALDYVLILGVVLPLVAFIMWVGPRVIRLAYEMVCVLVSWPWM